MRIQEIAINGTSERKGKKYPVEVYPVRVTGYGVLRIKIYFKFRAKGSYWLVEDRSSGKRRLLNCSSHDGAHKRAKQVAEAIAKGQQAVLRLNRRDLDSYEIAKESIAPFNVSVHFVCQEWTQAKVMLAGRGNVLDAIRFYVDHGGDGLTPKTFNEATEAFLQLKAQQGISIEQQRKIRSRLGKVAVRFGEHPLHGIIPGELEQFLSGLSLSPKTFNHYRKTLSALYNFARTNRYTPKNFNPAKEFPAATEGFRLVEFFKPEQMKRLLAAAQTSADLLYLTLCAFAGLRPCECARLRWEMLNEDYIRLPVGISGKKGRPRDVEIQQNLKLWLAPYRKKSGRVLPENFDIRIKPSELAKLAGIVWIPDGLRHAYGTYLYATVKNIDKVTDQMGNTREICKRHYINKLVTESEGHLWFAIRPEGCNVIPMLAAVEDNPATHQDSASAQSAKTVP